jgi:hypothetical protein
MIEKARVAGSKWYSSVEFQGKMIAVHAEIQAIQLSISHVLENGLRFMAVNIIAIKNTSIGRR